MTTASPSAARPSSPAVTLALVGGAVWLAFLVWQQSLPLEQEWSHALLLLAPLVLVPLVVGLVLKEDQPSWARQLLHIAQAAQFPAAFLLLLAYMPLASLLAGWLALPWLAVTVLMAAAGLLRFWQPDRKPADVCLDVGLIFVVVGGAWVVLDRFAVQPLGFPAVIVLLTGIHFHYAGLLLPILAGLATRQLPGQVSTLTAVGVIAGPPLVAVGITVNQYNVTLGTPIEAAAAVLLAFAGLIVAGLHLFLALWRKQPILARLLWSVAGLTLAFSMVLAALYGLRFYAGLDWLDIPWMRALHGTANALGFGLCGVVGWIVKGDRV